MIASQIKMFTHWTWRLFKIFFQFIFLYRKIPLRKTEVPFKNYVGYPDHEDVFKPYFYRVKVLNWNARINVEHTCNFLTTTCIFLIKKSFERFTWSKKLPTSPRDCLIKVITFWISSELLQYSPKIHKAALWILK